MCGYQCSNDPDISSEESGSDDEDSTLEAYEEAHENHLVMCSSGSRRGSRRSRLFSPHRAHCAKLKSMGIDVADPQSITFARASECKTVVINIQDAVLSQNMEVVSSLVANTLRQHTISSTLPSSSSSTSNAPPGETNSSSGTWGHTLRAMNAVMSILLHCAP